MEIQCGKLKNEENEAFLNKYGFCYIRDFISKSNVKQMFSLFKKIHTCIDNSKNQWNSLYDLDNTESNSISKAIRDIIYPSFENIFSDFEIPIATYMSKNPIAGSTCELHRDFSIYDENKVQFRNFWIPLIDINEKNGALYVVPGSHKIFTDIRPMFTDWQYEHFRDNMMHLKKTIYASAGDLILYTDRTLHGSHENKTSEPRPVVHGGVLPINSPLCYYHYSEPYLKKHRVNIDFYLKREFLDLEKLNNYLLEDEYIYQPKEININNAISQIDTLFREVS
jgi:hypothetical protein